jgi:hypothetical protein
MDKPSPMLHQLHIDQFTRPLRFISMLGPLVIILWLQSFGSSVVEALRGNFVVLAVMLAYGFTAWVCWRTIDVISVLTDPLMHIAYRVLGALCLILVLIFGALTAFGDDIGTGSFLSNFVGFIQYLFVGIMTILAVRSLKRLRRTKIDKIGITLEELVRSLRPTTPAKQTPWFSTVLKSPGALRFIVIAVILFSIYSGINIYANSLIETSVSLEPQFTQLLDSLNTFSTLCFAATCYFLLRARAKLQPTAESVLSTDRRTPVLFLRSFVDDERVHFDHSEAGRALFDFSLEARLATHFFKTGPFIAVDSPNHTPAIGAARASLTDTEWQGTVVEWMRAARLIVLLAGLTQWVRWEMKQSVELGYSRKLIILMPELSGRKRLRSDIATKRLEAIRETFSGSPWEAGINEPCVPENIRSLMFGPDGQVTAVCAKSRSRDCFQLAALISEYLICKEKKNEVREAA